MKTQNVAEHSYHVAHIALWVSRYHSHLHTGDHDDEIMYYALIHDELESWYGDIPSPANGHMPNKHVYEAANKYGASGASPAVAQVLKVADLFEAYLFVLDERKLGNTGMERILQDIHRKLNTQFATFEFIEPDLRYTIIGKFAMAYDVAVHPVMEQGSD